MSQFLGENTGKLLEEAKKIGNVKKIFFKPGIRIKRSAKNEGKKIHFYEQVDFASSRKEGILSTREGIF